MDSEFSNLNFTQEFGESPPHGTEPPLSQSNPYIEDPDSIPPPPLASNDHLVMDYAYNRNNPLGFFAPSQPTLIPENPPIGPRKKC